MHAPATGRTPKNITTMRLCPLRASFRRLNKTWCSQRTGALVHCEYDDLIPRRAVPLSVGSYGACLISRCQDGRPIGQPPLDRWAIPDWPAPLDPHLPPPPPMVVLATCVAFGRGIPGVVGSVLRELRRAMTALDAPIKSGHDEWRVLSSHRLTVSPSLWFNILA